MLDFEEASHTGEFRFSCRPRLRGLDRLLRVCLIPELLLPVPGARDQHVENLLKRSRSLCTTPEGELFDQLLCTLPDRRLGLLWLPQRLLESMVRPASRPAFSAADRVDFALEVPSLVRPDWLKLVIELDDDTHTGAQVRKDQERDRCLREAGWRVVRMHVRRRSEWRAQLEKLAHLVKEALSDEGLRAAQEVRGLPARQRRVVQNLVLLPAAEGQILAALARLLHQGSPARIRIGDPQGHGLAPVINAVAAVVGELSRVHRLVFVPQVEEEKERPDEADLLYFGIPDPAAWDAIQAPRLAVLAPRPVWSEYVEPLLPAPARPIAPADKEQAEPVRAALLYLLQNVFRKTDFWEGQPEIITRALTLKPVVGLLPTAAGKSLCFQLASLVQPGFTLVIDPLRSLMLDQQENLGALGIHRCLAIMSGLEPTVVRAQAARTAAYRSVENGEHLFVFVAPERLQMPEFRQHLRSFASSVPISYCVVDEAHCVSEWGHDFRPAYLNIGWVAREYCAHQGRPPCVMALSGTASRNVLVDILRELAIDDQEAIVEPRSFDRAELTFEVCRVRSQERLPQLSGKLRSILTELGWQAGQPGAPPNGLIFTNFPTAGDVGVLAIAADLGKHLGLPVEVYCGARPHGMAGSEGDWERTKLETQRRFKRDESPVLVCGYSFGMGIDKPNIRFTIHAMLPRSLEDFYQQAGRAGRDRTQARCIILFSDDQPGLADELLDTERTPLEEIARKAHFVSQKKQGDAVRNTWFLTQNFLGRELEKAILGHVVNHILWPATRSSAPSCSPTWRSRSSPGRSWSWPAASSPRSGSRSWARCAVWTESPSSWAPAAVNWRSRRATRGYCW